MDNPASKGKLNPALLLFLIFPVIAIVAALAIVIQSSQRGQTSGTGPVPPVVGYTPAVGLVNTSAPDFSLQSPDGQAVRLSSLHGQWVLLNFWATWCPPCKEEMPTFQKLLDGGFGPIKGKITVLAVDSLESDDQVHRYVNDLKLSIPIVMDKDGAVGRQFGVVNLPVTYVIDPGGTIRYQQLGEVTPALLQDYLKVMTPGQTGS